MADPVAAHGRDAAEVSENTTGVHPWKDCGADPCRSKRRESFFLPYPGVAREVAKGRRSHGKGWTGDENGTAGHRCAGFVA